MSYTKPHRNLKVTTKLTNATPRFTDNKSCIVILDRSGSMRDNGLETVERELSAFAQTFEEFGGEFALIDMYENSVRVPISFDTLVKDSIDKIHTGEAFGSTPLSDALDVATSHANSRSNSPCIIVITDGRPNNREDYFEGLQQSPIPVYGILLTSMNDSNNIKKFKQQLAQYTTGLMSDNCSHISVALEQLTRLDTMEGNK